MRHLAVSLAASAVLIGFAGCVRSAGDAASGVRATTPEPQWAGRARLAAPTLQALAEAAGDGERLVEDLRHLTDIIGPRLTGSAALRRANEWVAQRLRENSLDTVWLEPFTVPAAWERGPVALMQLAPHRTLLRATALAWSPPTPGTVTGEVLLWQERNASARRIAGIVTPDVRNAWLIFPEGSSDGPVAGIADDSTLALVAAGHAAGVLLSGPDDPLRMLRLGSPRRRPPLPHLVLPQESYDRLARLAGSGVPARLEGTVSAMLTPGSVAGYNTVGEVRGGESPAEVVLVAVPLDSWDDAVLSANDAAVVAAVIEAARILAVSRVSPRRTIRFAFLGGEMQEALGAAEYASRHAPALRRHVAIIRASAPLDVEERSPKGITLRVRPDLEAFAYSVRALSHETAGPLAVEPGAPGETPLAAAGAPLFEVIVDASVARGTPGEGAASTARDAARRLAITALALAELETFPRRGPSR